MVVTCIAAPAKIIFCSFFKIGKKAKICHFQFIAETFQIPLEIKDIILNLPYPLCTWE